MLSEEEQLIQQSAKQYAQHFLQPRILQSYRNETFDRTILSEMGKSGLLGTTIHGYGCIRIKQLAKCFYSIENLLNLTIILYLLKYDK